MLNPPIQRRGLLMVLSSPSGAGKTTISRRLLETDEQLTLSVSVTTRAPRANEIDGRDYHFIDATEFNLMVNREQLLEHAKVFGNYYGTPRHHVENTLVAGRDVLFDIDWQGTQQLGQNSKGDLVSIFILPPSWRELERRLYSRALDDPSEINRRMAKASDEMSHWAEYDYVIVNFDLEQSVQMVREILHTERLKRHRQTGLHEFINGLKQGQ